MPAKILFKYTSRSRVENFFRGLNSIVDNLANKEDYFILCSFDVDDSAYANSVFVERLAGYKNLRYYFGFSDCKVAAINRDMPLAPAFDILINFSDDQIFIHPGFDDIIREDFGGNFDMFLHYPDDNVGHLIPTMSVMGVDYYNRDQYIYHPSYRNVYCDNEAMCAAQMRGKYKFIDKKIFDHLHPAFGRAPLDEQYKKTEEPLGYKIDGENFINRKRLNFPT